VGGMGKHVENVGKEDADKGKNCQPRPLNDEGNQKTPKYLGRENRVSVETEREGRETQNMGSGDWGTTVSTGIRLGDRQKKEQKGKKGGGIGIMP